MHIHHSVLLTFIDPKRILRHLAVNPSQSFSYNAGLKRSTSSPPLLYNLNLALNRMSTHEHTHTHTQMRGSIIYCNTRPNPGEAFITCQ